MPFDIDVGVWVSLEKFGGTGWSKVGSGDITRRDSGQGGGEINGGCVMSSIITGPNAKKLESIGTTPDFGATARTASFGKVVRGAGVVGIALGGVPGLGFDPLAYVQ